MGVPRAIALIGKYQSPDLTGALGELARFLQDRGVTVFIDAETAEHLGSKFRAGDWIAADFETIGSRVDVAIVLGGDGTMLNAARRLSRFRVPLVGVNQGRLGFMTDIARSDMLSCMDDLLEGRFVPENRLMLDAEIMRDGRELVTNLALNDVVVDKGAIGRMIELELFINSEFIYKLRADGLIVTTATGSTAYALSANGPIMHPNLPGIGLVPLCPHALTNRPIVIGGRPEIELRISSGVEPRVHFDGQLTVDLRKDDSVHLRPSVETICFLHPPGYSYFSMLRQKLHWSERPTGH